MDLRPVDMDGALSRPSDLATASFVGGWRCIYCCSECEPNRSRLSSWQVSPFLSGPTASSSSSSSPGARLMQALPRRVSAWGCMTSSAPGCTGQALPRKDRPGRGCNSRRSLLSESPFPGSSCNSFPRAPLSRAGQGSLSRAFPCPFS